MILSEIAMPKMTVKLKRMIGTWTPKKCYVDRFDRGKKKIDVWKRQCKNEAFYASVPVQFTESPDKAEAYQIVEKKMPITEDPNLIAFCKNAVDKLENTHKIEGFNHIVVDRRGEAQAIFFDLKTNDVYVEDFYQVHTKSTRPRSGQIRVLIAWFVIRESGKIEYLGSDFRDEDGHFKRLSDLHDDMESGDRALTQKQFFQLKKEKGLISVDLDFREDESIVSISNGWKK
jgi:hypothetical protein